MIALQCCVCGGPLVHHPDAGPTVFACERCVGEGPVQLRTTVGTSHVEARYVGSVEEAPAGAPRGHTSDVYDHRSGQHLGILRRDGSWAPEYDGD